MCNELAYRRYGNKIAFCIPTKNRYLCMKEMLEYLEDKKNICPMDIFIYDSSDDDKTKNLAAKFEYHGGKLTYINVNDYQGDIANKYSAECAIKVYQIYKTFAGSEVYDYIWLCSDSQRFSNGILERVCCMPKEYSMISITDEVYNNYNEEMEGLKEKEYLSAENYIKYNTVGNSLYGAVLVSTKILGQLDWQEVYAWCNDEKICSYIQIKIYSELACMVENFKAVVITDENALTISILKTDVGWRKHFLHVTVDGWKNVIESLKVSEDTKNYILNYIYTNIKIDKDYLLRLRMWEVYDRECLSKYRDYIFNCVTEVEAEAVLNISPGELQAWYGEAKTRLNTLLNNHRKIIIYGAGMYAKIWYSILYNLNIEVAGFVVTNKENNPSNLMELPVFVLDDIKDKLNDTGVVIGISKDKAIGIQEILRQYIKEEDIYFEEDWRMVAY